MILPAALATVALAAAPVAPAASTPAPAPAQAALAALSQCDGTRVVKTGGGWQLTTPGVWESTSVRCNLVYGDFPHRNPAAPFGDPLTSIKTLQQTLNYCYGRKIVVNGFYGATTRDAIRTVQRRYGLPADGIYGPQTRSAMNWRLFNGTTYSEKCYSPI